MRRTFLWAIAQLFFWTLLVGCDEKQTKQNSFEVAKTHYIGKQAVVLEIGSKSCHSCQQMLTRIEKIQHDDPQAPIHVIDVYDDMQAFAYFKVQMIPTQLLLNADGTERYRHVGVLPSQDILALIKQAKRLNQRSKAE